MKLIQLDLNELTALDWFTSNPLTPEQLDGLNKHLADKQSRVRTREDITQERQQLAIALGKAKQIATLHLIAEYVRTLDDDKIAKCKIVDISKHIDRTEQTTRNVLATLAEDNNIAINGKLKKKLPDILRLLI